MCVCVCVLCVCGWVCEIGKTRLGETTKYTINLLHLYILLYNLIFFTIFVNNWFLWRRIINYNCSITNAHINSYLSNIATRQSKDHKTLRLLEKSPIYKTILIHFKYRFLSNTFIFMKQHCETRS